MSFRSRKDGSHYPVTPKLSHRKYTDFSAQQLLQRFENTNNKNERTKLKRAAVSQANKLKVQEEYQREAEYRITVKKMDVLTKPITLYSEPTTIMDNGQYEGKITVEYDPRLQIEAEAKPRGRILIGDKFLEIYSYSKHSANHILIHEIGHDLDGRKVPFNRENAVIFEKHRIYTGNYFEAFAESFAEYIDDPSTLKQNNPAMYTKHQQLEQENKDYYELGRKIKNNGVELKIEK